MTTVKLVHTQKKFKKILTVESPKLAYGERLAIPKPTTRVLRSITVYQNDCVRLCVLCLTGIVYVLDENNLIYYFPAPSIGE